MASKKVAEMNTEEKIADFREVLQEKNKEIDCIDFGDIEYVGKKFVGKK